MRSTRVVSARRRARPAGRLRSILLGSVMAATLVGSQTAIGGPIGLLTVAEARPATPAQPNRFDPKSAASSVLHRPQPGRAGAVPAGSQPYSAPRQLSVPMQPAMVAV